MADGSLPGVTPLRHQVSDEEWATRVELAALYRLAVLEHYDSGLGTHISARVPGEGNNFLINPFGLLFHEITASSLVKLDQEGNVLSPTGWGFNYAGYVIHSAIHAARDDAHFAAHFHTPDGVAVSAQEEGLLPLDQGSYGIARRIKYHDYEGVAVDLDERERLVADLGDGNVMLLRNHGTLAVGRTAGACWGAIHGLKRACTTQIRALTAGRNGVRLVPDNVGVTPRGTGNRPPNRFSNIGDLAWAANLRRVHAQSPGFDA